MPSVITFSRVAGDVESVNRTWYPTSSPSPVSSSSAIRSATDRAAIRRGWVCPIRLAPIQAAAAAQLEADLGQLGGLPGPGLAGDDDDLVVPDRRRDVVTAGADRELGWVGDLHNGDDSLPPEEQWPHADACALGLGAALAAPLLVLGACSDDTGAQTAGHTHAGGALVSLPVGDGTQASEVGYTMRDVRVPARAGVRGEVGFVIENFEGKPQTEFLEEQTKQLHLYVVRDDDEVFRHLHPTMAEDGAWTAPVTLPTGGDYRVIAEFVAEDEGGNGDHVILGTTTDGPRTRRPGGRPATRPSRSRWRRCPPSVQNGRLDLVVRDAEDRPVRLDTYLGTWAHVTGFQRESGAMLHLHPLSAPEVTEDGSRLTFHSEVEESGDYRLFVQVRIDGFLHTVPVGMTVT